MSHPWGSKDSTRSPGTSGWEKWTRSKRWAADPQSPCKPFDCIRVQTDLHPQGPFSLDFETQVGSASFYPAPPPTHLQLLYLAVRPLQLQGAEALVQPVHEGALGDGVHGEGTQESCAPLLLGVSVFGQFK